MVDELEIRRDFKIMNQLLDSLNQPQMTYKEFKKVWEEEFLDAEQREASKNTKH